MATAHTELLEIVLRECAAAEEQPWYPAAFANQTGVPRQHLETTLDQLRINGLVQLTPWVKENGQGYKLTAHGATVLEDSRLLGKLREGQVPQPPQELAATTHRHALAGVRGEQVRNSLLDDSRPVVTQTLVMANIAWFLVGAAVFMKLGGQFGDYLSGGGDRWLNVAYHDIGSLNFFDLLNNQWWRLVSYGFVHGGLMHLCMNMYALFVIGRLLERMWGRAIYLAIYLASCIGGGAFAVLQMSNTDYMVGASGAICGLLGSMLMWLMLNKSHLPAQLAASWQRGILINIVLLAIISLLPGISWQGHLGGGITGAVLAVPLNLARFGDGAKRLFGWLVMLALVITGLGLTYYQIERHEDEVKRFNQHYRAVYLDAEEVSRQALERIGKVISYGKNRPDEQKAEQLREQLLNGQELLNDDLRKLTSAGRLRQPELAELMTTGKAFFEATSELCGKAADVLKKDAAWPPPNLNTLRNDRNHILQQVPALNAAWRKCLELGVGN